jgi:hypothetical protein
MSALQNTVTVKRMRIRDSLALAGSKAKKKKLLRVYAL